MEALQAGAEVFATAGSPHKREFLKSLGVKHVMDSRALTFAREIIDATQGDGELSGVAIEQRATVTLQVDVIKNWSFAWPRLETDQFIMTIGSARPLEDAARIDGASYFSIYWRIILPLCRPVLATLGIFTFLGHWNDFLWPLIVLSHNELFTLQVGLNSFQGELQIQWNLILAMTVLTLLPVVVVFAFLQRYITTGIATTGLK